MPDEALRLPVNGLGKGFYGRAHGRHVQAVMPPQKRPGQNAVMFVDTPPDIEELSASTSKNGTPSGAGAR